MKKVAKPLVFIAVLGLSILMTNSFLWAGSVSTTKAHCSTCAAEMKEAQAQVKTETIIGELVSTAGTNQKVEEAKLKGKELSRDYAFRTPDGKLWSIVKTSQSEKLIATEYVGKPIEIKGRKDRNVQTIEVKSFKAVQKQSEKHAIKTAGSEKVVYTCPMHPGVTSDKPGDCPKCGMHLVKKQ